MDAKEIIADINSVYDRLHVMPNLREHMFRVAAVGALICDNWTGPDIDKNTIVAVLLVHDIGNIVKFRLDTPESRAMVSSMGGGGTDWQAVQSQIIQRYGTDDHVVTHKMMSELGVSERFLWLLDVAGNVFKSPDAVLESDDFELKLCFYPDLRVGPYGVVDGEQRIKDLINRYKYDNNRAEIYTAFYARLKTFENQIFGHVRLRPEEINDASVRPYVEKLKH